MNTDNNNNHSDQELVKAIGNYVRNRRLQKNISQFELANLSKVSMASITRFETGKGNISLQNLLSILSVLEMINELRDFFVARDNVPPTTQSRVRWSKKSVPPVPLEQ